MAQARSLIFQMGSTTCFLTDEYQDLTFVITERIVNGEPVWAAEDGEHFMYRGLPRSCGLHQICVDGEYGCARGEPDSDIHHYIRQKDIFAPTKVSPTGWVSIDHATVESHFVSATEDADEDKVNKTWVMVPEMRITVVHGLDDEHSKLVAALRMLAELG